MKVAPKSENGSRGYLDGQMLIAMPSMSDERFSRSLIYVCAHSNEGAMGIVVNQPASNVTFPELLVQLDVIPAADRIRRVLTYELIVANGAVRNLIRENQIHHLENTIQTGRKEGMTLMDNCLYDLYCKCLITYDTAVSRARHPDRILRK